MKQQIDTAMNKEMDRLAFLKLVGVSLVALTGASAVFKVLEGATGSSHAQAAGYGSSSYGGGMRQEAKSS